MPREYILLHAPSPEGHDSDYGPPKVWITETYEDALQAVNRQGRNN